MSFKVIGGIGVAVVIALLAMAWQQSARPLSVLESLIATGGEPTPVEAPGSGPGSLWVNADPVGSTVYVDGELVGVTPLWLDGVDAGERHVQVVSADGAVYDAVVYVEPGQMVEADLSADATASMSTVDLRIEESAPVSAGASETGALRVMSVPAGATVVLNGRHIGTTPVALVGLGAGRHTVVLSKPGYESVARWVDLRGGVEVEAVIDLRPRGSQPAQALAAPPPPRPSAQPAPRQGMVEVLVRPWGTILIDGVIRQRDADVAYRTPLPVGTHSIRVLHPTLGAAERKVVVREGGITPVQFDLRGSAPPPATPDVQALPLAAAALPPPPEPGPSALRVLESAEVQPELIGGLAGLQRRVEYPEFAYRAGIDGQVLVQFVVDERGSVVEPVVLESPSDLLSTAALEAVRASRFTPGRQGGEPVKVRVTVPVTFRIR